MNRTLPGVLCILLAAVLPLHAQGDVAGTTIPPAFAAVAPAEAREVVAEGRAAIGKGGVIAARRAAEAQALRNAVEKTTGVFVGARTLTQNYVLVRDQVVTHAEGYATLKDVLRESIGTQEVSVMVRALVSLRPLAEQLKALNLTRAWRVRVTAEKNDSAITAVERSLTDAGFAVVSSDADADLVVRVTSRFTNVAETPLDTAVGPMIMYTVRGDLGVRATRAQTGEVVAALSTEGTALHINVVTARANVTEAAMKTLAPRLSDVLMVLPARDSQPVLLVVSHIGSTAQASRLEDALNTLIGVRGVTRRAYTNGEASWEIDVLSEALPEITRELESLRPFHLKVSSETRAKIAATATPVSASPVKTARRK